MVAARDVLQEMPPLRVRKRLLLKHLHVVLGFVVGDKGEVAVIMLRQLVDNDPELVLFLEDLFILLAVLLVNFRRQRVAALPREHDLAHLP